MQKHRNLQRDVNMIKKSFYIFVMLFNHAAWFVDRCVLGQSALLLASLDVYSQ